MGVVAVPFCGPWPMWWVFPIIGFGFMIAFAFLVVRPVMMGLFGIQPGSRDKRATAAAPRAPVDVLRDRYARGEITRETYRQALADVLKDRYVRGEITLDEFEARLERLLSEHTPGNEDGDGGLGQGKSN